jgi:hypothetical protein
MLPIFLFSNFVNYLNSPSHIGHLGGLSLEIVCKKYPQYQQKLDIALWAILVATANRLSISITRSA